MTTVATLRSKTPTGIDEIEAIMDETRAKRKALQSKLLEFNFDYESLSLLIQKINAAPSNQALRDLLAEIFPLLDLTEDLLRDLLSYTQKIQVAMVLNRKNNDRKNQQTIHAHHNELLGYVGTHADNTEPWEILAARNTLGKVRQLRTQDFTQEIEKFMLAVKAVAVAYDAKSDALLMQATDTRLTAQMARSESVLAQFKKAEQTQQTFQKLTTLSDDELESLDTELTTLLTLAASNNLATVEVMNDTQFFDVIIHSPAFRQARKLQELHDDLLMELNDQRTLRYQEQSSHTLQLESAINLTPASPVKKKRAMHHDTETASDHTSSPTDALDETNLLLINSRIAMLEVLREQVTENQPLMALLEKAKWLDEWRQHKKLTGDLPDALAANIDAYRSQAELTEQAYLLKKIQQDTVLHDAYDLIDQFAELHNRVANLSAKALLEQNIDLATVADEALLADITSELASNPGKRKLLQLRQQLNVIKQAIVAELNFERHHWEWHFEYLQLNYEIEEILAKIQKTDPTEYAKISTAFNAIEFEGFEAENEILQPADHILVQINAALNRISQEEAAAKNNLEASNRFLTEASTISTPQHQLDADLTNLTAAETHTALHTQLAELQKTIGALTNTINEILKHRRKLQDSKAHDEDTQHSINLGLRALSWQHSACIAKLNDAKAQAASLQPKIEAAATQAVAEADTVLTDLNESILSARNGAGILIDQHNELLQSTQQQWSALTLEQKITIKMQFKDQETLIANHQAAITHLTQQSEQLTHYTALNIQQAEIQGIQNEINTLNSEIETLANANASMIRVMTEGVVNVIQRHHNDITNKELPELLRLSTQAATTLNTMLVQSETSDEAIDYTALAAAQMHAMTARDKIAEMRTQLHDVTTSAEQAQETELHHSFKHIEKALTAAEKQLDTLINQAATMELNRPAVRPTPQPTQQPAANNRHVNRVKNTLHTFLPTSPLVTALAVMLSISAAIKLAPATLIILMASLNKASAIKMAGLVGVGTMTAGLFRRRRAGSTQAAELANLEQTVTTEQNPATEEATRTEQMTIRL